MLYEDLVDLPIDVFGGYSPAIPPADLPPGGATVAQDVVFPLTAVGTRGGLFNYFGAPGGANNPLAANAAVNGLKSYLTPTLAQRLLVWDSLGNLYKENPQGTLNLVASRPYAGLFYQSSTLFGREYQAFFNSLGGFDIPRQFDDTNWDRVSQVGPGAAPAATDESLSYNVAASPNGASMTSAFAILASPSGATEVGNVCTIVLASTGIAGPKVGDSVVIAGVGVAGYNGTFKILSINYGGGITGVASFTYFNPTAGLAASGGGSVDFQIAIITTTVANNFVTGQLVTTSGITVAGYNVARTSIRYITSATVFAIYVGVTGLAASGAGTAVPVGNIAAGLHQLSVAFITRQGFITQAAPPSSFTASGNLRAAVSAIPVGPPNVVARLLLFSPVIVAPATTGSLFSLPTGNSAVFASAMLINDNTTTTLAVDFTDTILSAGFQANYLQTQTELGEAGFVVGYNSRLFWLSERNKVANLLNPTFDGGFGTDTSGRKFPLGWAEDTTSFAGGGSASAQALAIDWGDAFVITGDGATATRGKISQSAYQDFLGVPIIARQTAYRVRARVARTAGLVAGTLHIQLQSTLSPIGTAGLSVTAAQAAATYAEFDALLTTALASPPTDLVLQVYADGTPTNNQSFLVDSIEVYPSNAPFNYSVVRCSHAFNPESYDSTTGQIQIRPNDGQQLRAGFTLRDNLYLAKDHYLCYVVDDGVNEPSSWSVREVSSTIGICGPNAVDGTEEWFVFAERSGLYICWGSDPVKITPEIQIDATGQGRMSWQSINWAAAHTIWVRIDRVNKMILVGAPTGAATTPNIVFMLDYGWLETAQDIAHSPLITYSAFTGRMLSHGRGRRWSIWNITANSMTFAERSDGTAQPSFGNGAANGLVYQQLVTQLSDNGVAVNSQWQSSGIPAHIQEQELRMRSDRKVLGYLKWRAAGAGSLLISVTAANRTTNLRSYTLGQFPVADAGMAADLHGERFFIQVGTNAVGARFRLEKLIPYIRRDATIPVRGTAA